MKNPAVPAPVYTVVAPCGGVLHQLSVFESKHAEWLGLNPVDGFVVVSSTPGEEDYCPMDTYLFDTLTQAKKYLAKNVKEMSAY